MTIQAGDWIKVPKGTILEHDGYKTPDTPTSRDVVVQISSVSQPSSYQIERLLDEEDRKQFRTELFGIQGASTYGQGHTDETRRAAQQKQLEVFNRYRAIATAKIGGGDLTVVNWSNDKKGAWLHTVEQVEAPAPRKKPEIKINKKQQMVKGSKWKLTQDVVITFLIENPEVQKRQAAWEKANPRPLDTGGTMDQDMKWREVAIAHRKKLEAELGKEVDGKVRECKAGELFTVVDKFQTYNPYHILDKTAGAIALIQFDGDAKWIHARYKQLEPIIEADSIPTVDVYVLRNKTNGLFFKGTEWNEEKTKEAQKIKGTKWGIWHEHAVYDAIFVEQFMKAKHFDNLGRAKSSILEMTGYYHELPGSENLPEWMGHAASFEFTQDYELVKFDKLARAEVEVIDLWEWYQSAWRLRELTVKYGSSVRGCYKELEKKNLLEEQSGMIVFTASEDAQDRAINYGDRSALTSNDKEEINSAIAVAGLKKGKYKRGEDSKSIAVSFANKGAALMFKLAYNGNLKTTVIDLAEMKEVVEAAA